MASSEGAEILVKFVTQFDDIRVPASALSVPASLNKAGLSQVIGHILGDGACCGMYPSTTHSSAWLRADCVATPLQPARNSLSFAWPLHR